MPHRKALDDFNKKNKYVIKDKLLINYVGSVVRNNVGNTNEVQNQFIRTRIQNYLPAEALKYERQRQQMLLLSKAKPNDRKLKATVDAMSSPARFVEGCVKLFEVIAKEEAHKQGSTYNPLPFFEFKGSEFVDLVKAEANSYKYAEGRRFEVFKAYGITDQRFINEARALGEIAGRGVTYETAKGSDKDDILKTYITKQLVDQRMKRHNFLWKLIFRSETKAMEAYLKAADAALKAVGFPEKVPTDDVKAFADQSYAMTDPTQKEQLLDMYNKWEKHVDKKVADEKEDRKNKKEAEEAEKLRKEEEAKIAKHESEIKKAQAKRNRLETAESKKAIADANGKPIEEALFETKFRPSLDPEEFKKQYDACKVLKDNLPAGTTKKMKQVLYENTNKLSDMKKFQQKVGDLSEAERQHEENKLINSFYDREEKVEAIVNNPIKGDPSKEYKPVIHSNKETIALHEQLGKEFNESSASKQEPAVSTDQLVKQKEEIVKSEP